MSAWLGPLAESRRARRKKALLHSLSLQPPLEKDSTQLYSCKRASHERLLVHIRINFPTLFPIVCRRARLFLGPRQRLLISICSLRPTSAASRPAEGPTGQTHLSWTQKVVRVKRVNSGLCFILKHHHQQRQTDQCRQKWLGSKSALFNCEH